MMTEDKELSQQDREELVETLKSNFTDQEIDGLLGLHEFLDAFDDAEERLAKFANDKPNYCPNCGEEL